VSDLLADSVAIVHGCLLLLDGCGAIFVMRGAFRRPFLKRWQWAWLGLAGAKAASYLVLDNCPLTLLEQRLRSTGESAGGFTGSFVEQYLPWVPGEIDAAVTMLLMLCGLIGVLQAASRSLGQRDIAISSREAL
jgi:hypothetical protein